MEPCCSTQTTATERQMYQDSFTSKVQRFMVSNTVAFNTLTAKTANPNPSPELHPLWRSSYYGNPLPLEYVMGVPIDERQQRLLEVLCPGDLIRGHVILKTPLALGVQITSLIVSHKVREMSDLDVRGLVQHENLATDKSKCEGVLEEMELDDVIQAVVVCKLENHFSISFSSENVSQLCPSGQLPEDICLGYLEGERPASKKQRPNSPSFFLSGLEECPGFTNPSSGGNLKDVLGIAGYESETKPSLLKTIQTANYPVSDHFHILRKVQRHKWSMDTVAVGVKHFKKGELSQAKKLLDHALDIDPSNVEGLVAKGALYANNGSYSAGIVNFERALTINHGHKNARKYLVETQMAYGEELEKQGRLERALVCYQEALADDPSKESAKTRINTLRSVLEKKAAERLEKERKEAAENARMKKLHSLIKEEKEKKEKKKRHKPAKKKKRKGHSSKNKTKHRKSSSKHKDYSTEDESFSSDSESSSRSRSRSETKRRNYSRSPSISDLSSQWLHETKNLSPKNRETGRISRAKGLYSKGYSRSRSRSRLSLMSPSKETKSRRDCSGSRSPRQRGPSRLLSRSPPRVSDGAKSGRYPGPSPTHRTGHGKKR